MTLPLAIYTATHGLEWKYPSSEISYLELDCIRKVFGRLPDFDSGEKGFEGVYATATRCFIVKCFCAPKWDFQGRNAVYLAVTWVDRKGLESLDFRAILSASEFSHPMKNPPCFFAVEIGGSGDDIFRERIAQRLHDKTLTAFAEWREIGGAQILHREWRREPELPQPRPLDLPKTNAPNIERLHGNNGIFVPKNIIAAYLYIVAILIVLVILLAWKAWPIFEFGNAAKPAEIQSTVSKYTEQTKQPVNHPEPVAESPTAEAPAAEVGYGTANKAAVETKQNKGNTTNDSSR